jgi:biopolymer transport protein ExbD
MAMSMGGTNGGPVSSINVTPMADIMIVLLIIFMLIAPFLDHREGVQLPQASNSHPSKEGGVVVVTVRNDTTAFVGDERVDNLGELLMAVQRGLDETPGAEHTVYLKADRNLPYAEVEKVMDVCREAGAERVALMTDVPPPTETGA